jgi:hypothetical protein
VNRVVAHTRNQLLCGGDEGLVVKRSWSTSWYLQDVV